MGSLAKDVNRFSRLFSDHVCVEPDAVTMVPKRSFAIAVGPRQRCFLVAVRDDRVGSAFVRTPPRPLASVIEGGASGMRSPVRGSTLVSGREGEAGPADLDRMWFVELRAQVASIATEDRAGHGLDEGPFQFAGQIAAEQVGSP